MLSETMPYEKKFAYVNGKKIAYLEEGSGDPLHFIQEDSPVEIGQAVANWLKTI